MAIKPHFFDFTQFDTKQLAAVIGVEPSFLQEVIDARENPKLYARHQIPKKTVGLVREVWEIISPDLLAAHKSFQRKFEHFVQITAGYPTDEAHGYVTRRSTYTNALPHAGSKFILHADMENFFQTITHGRVEGLFRDLGISANTSDALSKFLTINEALPLGFPASPLLANLICRDLDKNLRAHADEVGVIFTRYADDLTFSSNETLPEKIDIEAIVIAQGFKLSQKKFWITKRGQSHFVTGLSVSDDKPRIPRKLKRRVRQELHYSKNFGLKAHLSRIKESTVQSGVNRLDGTINYIHAIEPELAQKLQDQWKKILEVEEEKVAYLSRVEKEPWPLSIYIDESEIQSGDGKILAIGCVSIKNVEEVSVKTLEILKGILDDPFADSNKKELRKKGLHFVDVSENGRNIYIDALHYLSFRSFIIYDMLPDPAKYREKYFELLSRIILPRLSASDRAEVKIVIEQNSKIPFEEVKVFIEDAYHSLAANHQRRPYKLPEIIVGRKLEQPCISVVDFILAIWGRYASLDYNPDPDAIEEKKRTQPGKLISTRFERLREKIRLIVSAPTGEFFGQKNAFVPWSEGKPTTPKD
ncbi:MAG TPA: reverse transcriptase family protein [Pyrinomonadaceae bacterium]|jgi:hypothetical protein|nr:reverse transcriptase family protein [Pyrinomonadaceae bacterium]